MDLGTALWQAMATVGSCGLAAHMWRTRRRRPQPVPTATRSYVKRVPPPRSSPESSEAARSAAAVPVGVQDSGGTRSMAVEAWASIAGGAEWEAKLASARRRVEQSPLFGDNALRKVKR